MAQDNLEEMIKSEKIITKENLKTVKYVELFILVIKASLPELKLKDDTELLKNLKNLQDGNYFLLNNTKSERIY